MLLYPPFSLRFAPKVVNISTLVRFSDAVLIPALPTGITGPRDSAPLVLKAGPSTVGRVFGIYIQVQGKCPGR